MTAASSASRSSAVPACPVEASWIACAARPGGIQRIHTSTPAKLAGVSLPSAVSFGTTWVKTSYKGEDRDDQEGGEVLAAA